MYFLFNIKQFKSNMNKIDFTELNEEDLKELKDIFEKTDSNKDGKVTFEEFKNLLNLTYGLKLSDKNFHDMVKTY